MKRKKDHFYTRKLLNRTVHIWNIFKAFDFKGKYRWLGRDAFKEGRHPSMVVLDHLEIVHRN